MSEQNQVMCHFGCGEVARYTRYDNIHMCDKHEHRCSNYERYVMRQGGVYTEAPDYSYQKNTLIRSANSVFLAGSITGAVDWQAEVAPKLLPYWHVFNPRHANYDGLIPDAEREQITWEFDALAFCNTILFYFSNETLAPITLLEYGKMLKSGKNLFVCIHPDYKRKNDVLIQTELEEKNPHEVFKSYTRRKVQFATDLDDLVTQVNEFAYTR